MVLVQPARQFCFAMLLKIDQTAGVWFFSCLHFGAYAPELLLLVWVFIINRVWPHWFQNRAGFDFFLLLFGAYAPVLLLLVWLFIINRVWPHWSHDFFLAKLLELMLPYFYFLYGCLLSIESDPIDPPSGFCWSIDLVLNLFFKRITTQHPSLIRCRTNVI